MTPAKIYPFSIPAGGSFPLLVIGDYCKILTSSGALEIDGDSFGTIGPILAGQGVQDAPFHRLVLNDRSGATNNGTILIADNAFIDDRITGSVEVIDGEKSRVLSNQYIGLCPALSPVNFANLQIWNPAGSGKNIYLNSFVLNASVASSIIFHRSITALTTNVSSTRVSNLNLGILTQSVEARVEDKAAAYAYAENSFMLISVGANQNVVSNLKNPILIRPGLGLNATCMNSTNTITLNATVYEEAIL